MNPEPRISALWYAVIRSFSVPPSTPTINTLSVMFPITVEVNVSFPAPKDRRMLATWMSYDDLERLVVACLNAPLLGHTVIYGMSRNARSWWDNTSAAHIGFMPLDSSERFRAELEARQPTLDVNDPVVRCQGGAFVAMGPFEE